MGTVSRFFYRAGTIYILTSPVYQNDESRISRVQIITISQEQLITIGQCIIRE
ncbi:hypothetical protein BJX65DRAFT_262827 [Aspergillus insuetus]